MDSKSVQKKYEKLQAAKRKVEEEIKILQNTCTHELAHRKFDADTGNYCKSDDSYWVEVKCPSCGYFEIFDSVDDSIEYRMWSNK